MSTKNVSIKKDQDFYTFILKKLTFNPILLIQIIIIIIIIIETQIFPKLITKMFHSFFLSTRNYLLFDFIKKIKIIERKKKWFFQVLFISVIQFDY